MPLQLNEPTFDRSFEEIYRDLRDRIPRYNPEWTNFNDSDPGITLLQLFSWLAEMTLHRMNDVPRKHYVKFAELLGLQLRPPRPATVELAFSAKPAERPATIQAGSRVSAQAGGGTVIFETTDALDVVGAELANVVVFAGGAPVAIDAAARPAQPFFPFGRNPQPGDALHLGFKPHPGNPKPFPVMMRFLALRPEEDTRGEPQRAGDQNLDLVAPVDLVWEFRPKDGQNVWERLNVFDDGTVAFTRDGYVQVEGPQAIEPSKDPALATLVTDPRYWIRVRLDQNNYPAGRAPRLEFLLPNAVRAINLETENERDLGTSNGRANQYFDLPPDERPVYPGSLKLEVRPAGAPAETDWIAVPDLFGSKRDDRHFQLDEAAGRITFGDGSNGVIPTSGAQIVAVTWRHGGGRAANDIEPGAIRTIVDQTAGIERVTNVRRPTGGEDEEPLQTFQRRAPGELRRGGRTITAEDFELVARSVGGVKAARALAGRHPDHRGVDVPGAVTILVVADSDQKPPHPSAELIRSVCRALDQVRLITTEVYVAGPTFIEIRVEARVLAAPEAAFDQVAADARKQLDDFLSPFKRKFGEDVSPAALYAQIFASSGQIRSVEDLLVYVDGLLHTPGRPVQVPPDALVYSGNHLIVVRPDRDDRTS